jgi:integrase
MSSKYARSTVKARYWQLVSFISEEARNKTIENQLREVDYSKISKNFGSDSTSAEGQGARVIKWHEYKAMVEATDVPRLKLICYILWQTGLRATELAHLEIDDIDLEEREIEVQTAKREDHERTLHFNLNLKNELRKWINARRHQSPKAADSPYLLVTNQSEKYYSQNLTQAVKNLADDAGVQDYNKFQRGGRRAEITPHSFRKRFGIERLKESNIRKAQLLLGHSSVTMTQEYLDLSDEDLSYEPHDYP